MTSRIINWTLQTAYKPQAQMAKLPEPRTNPQVLTKMPKNPKPQNQTLDMRTP